MPSYRSPIFSINARVNEGPHPRLSKIVLERPSCQGLAEIPPHDKGCPCAVALDLQPISRDAESYSLHVTGIPIRDVRRDFFMAIMGGINEMNVRKLEKPEIEAQWKSAAAEAGPKFLLSPGYSVPNDSAPAELQKLPAAIGA